MVAKYFGAKDAGTFKPPADVSFGEVDRYNGLLADSWTPAERKYIEYFLPGTEPPLLQLNPWKIPQWGPLIGH